MNDATVFVIDDAEPNRVLAHAFLQRLGWSVRCFERALPALAAAREQLPDAMLVDIRMPQMAGDELARILRVEFDGLPLRLVGYTAHAGSDELAAFLEAGFDAVLVKPTSFDAMRRALPGPGTPAEPCA